MTLRAEDEEWVYRLTTPEEWRAMEETGIAPLRPVDVEDGYIHLSTRTQLLATANKHFANAPELLALEIPLAAIGEAVRFELAPKRGEAFPHLYAELTRAAVTRVIKLDRTADGFKFGAAL